MRTSSKQIIRSRKNHKERKIDSGDVREITTSKGLKSNPLILYRAVEDDLIASLYEMNFYEIGKLKRGNLCLLLGTSAGFSIGATLFRY